jgi:hypothetical protein
VVRFPGRWVTWMKFRITGFTGTAPGLSEVEVYDEPRAAPALHVREVRDTAVRLEIAFPVERAGGNRLLWRSGRTEEWGALQPDGHLGEGTYVVNGLAAKQAYDFHLVYREPSGRRRRPAATAPCGSSRLRPLRSP